MQDFSSAGAIVRFGPFELDGDAGELRKDGTKVRLQEQPLQVLQILQEQPGKVITREELQKRIWLSDTFVDFDHGINNAIKRLREALGDTAETPQYIETLPRRGYRFIGNTVSAVPDGASSESPTLIDAAPPLPARTSGSRTQGFVSPPPVLEEGTVLAGRYQIVQTLGEGGMGAVYKAKDLEVDRLVALKLIRPELAKNPAIIDRFKQELRLSHRVTHRNVIRIYDLGEGEGVKFITMEYIEGQDLRSLIHERKRLSPPDAVGIMEEVCLALDAAHSVGVIHRDLKPQNIMVDQTGRVLVMDFGLARTLEGEGMTKTGALVGTMEYMSPEQALAKDLDQRSDLFSAGLIFYELLTGQMPFRADSGLASLIRRTQERALPISNFDASIPMNLSAIREQVPGAGSGSALPERQGTADGSGTLGG